MRIPIKDAKLIANTYGYDIVAIVAYNSKTNKQHVTTYGRSKQECKWAAVLGNRIKREILGWPEEECNAVPARVKREALEAVDYVNRECETCGKIMFVPASSGTTECSRCLE